MLSIFFVDLYKYACAHVCGRFAYTCCSYRLQFVLYCMYRFASIAFSVDFGLISLRVCSCVCVRSKKVMCIRACGKVFYHRRKKKEVLPVNANGLSQTHRSARPGTCLDSWPQIPRRQRPSSNDSPPTLRFRSLATAPCFRRGGAPWLRCARTGRSLRTGGSPGQQGPSFET